MYPISKELIDSVAADRRRDADDYRRAKAARIRVKRDRRQLRLPIPVAELLRRLALG